MRPLKLRVGTRRGVECPDLLAEAIASYLQGRSDTIPTVRVRRGRRG